MPQEKKAAGEKQGTQHMAYTRTLTSLGLQPAGNPDKAPRSLQEHRSRTTKDPKTGK